MVSPCGRADRRQFIKLLAAAGAAPLVPGVASSVARQVATGSSGRIIDVHHHYASPGYIASLAARDVGNNLDRFKGDTPEKHLAEMDKAGVATAMDGSAIRTVVQGHCDRAI